MKSRWAFAVIASLSWGCSAGTATPLAPADDSGSTDTSVAEEAGKDTAAGDDTAMGDDTNVADSGTPTDSETPTDTAMPDTTPPPDTAMPDTSMTCTSPSKVCSGTCVNVSADVNHCGECDVKCPTSGLCAGGTCACPVAKSTLCGSAPGLCADTKTDNNNCGACGNVCPTGKVCTMGVCACSTGLVACGTTCNDLSADPNTCGSCTNKCATGASCTSGVCACPTAKPDICSATCVDKKTDNAHCGACGNVCAVGATCVTTSSTTACQCPTGQIVCGGKCVSPATDTANCGGCGLTCTGGTCAGGTCSCPTGKVKCGGACVDVSTDPNNCGGCGISCGTSACVSGVCPFPTCKSITATKVLFYGPTSTLGVGEQPLLPPGAVVTIANETQWRSMTTTQFASFDIIAVGGGPTGATPAYSEFQALYDTRAVWGPAVTGRVALLGFDLGYHATMGSSGGMDVGAETLGKATFAWLARGPVGKTSLYVTSDSGSRNLAFLSSLGTFSSNAFTGDSVSVTDSTHPTMIGSTSASLSNWTVSYHSTIPTYPSTYKTVARGTTTSNTGPVMVVHDDPCNP